MRDVLLVGTGRMARQYVPVLGALKVKAIAVGRSTEGSQAFELETGTPTTAGGLAALKKQGRKIPKDAIITVDADKLAVVASEALSLGVKRILLEKPGGLTTLELKALERQAKRAKAQIYIAYNRRYYASVIEAKKMLKADRGPISFSFIFNERLGQREKLKELGIPEAAQKRWFIVNATHVIDLAFYLCGTPKKLVGTSVAGPTWAPHPTRYSGAGLTKNNVPFQYHANWELPGPWSIEIGTTKRKIVLNPLEKLSVEEQGEAKEIAFDATKDTAFKPGIYLQTKSFLEERPDLPTLSEQIEAFSWYEKIARGTF